MKKLPKINAAKAVKTSLPYCQKAKAGSGVRGARSAFIDPVSGFCYAPGMEASKRTRKPPRSRGVRPAHSMSGRGFGERPNKQERIFLSIACKKGRRYSIFFRLLTNSTFPSYYKKQ